ncbi:MAG: hypothetical protein AAB492_00195 [Patescibacteria group bacterium]
MAKPEINLLKKSSSARGTITTIERYLSLMMWWSLTGLLVLGVLIGTGYLYARYQADQVSQKNDTLLQSIRAQTVKEGFLVSLKQRAFIAWRGLDAAKPYGNLFPLLESIAPAEYFTNLSIDDVGRSTITVKLANMEDAVLMIANVLFLVEEKRLRSPQMLSFSLKETGFVDISLSFIANL